jgi:hypothetical protein
MNASNRLILILKMFQRCHFIIHAVQSGPRDGRNGSISPANPFDEGEDLDALESDAIEANEILYDAVRNAEHPQSTGNRYSNYTRKWVFEILLTGGIKGLTMIKDVIRIPYRKNLPAKPPDGGARSDLTDIDMLLERVRAWRKGLEGLSNQACPRCILACNALACKSAVEATHDGLSGLDARDFDMDTDLLERLTSSRTEFQEFVESHWDYVLTAAFVFQIQPLNPGLEPSLIFAPPAKDGKARGDETAFLTTLKEICGQGRITMGGFATDGDPAYDAFHEEQAARNLAFFRKDSTDIPLKDIIAPFPTFSTF